MGAVCPVRYAGNERVGEQTACARQKPVQGEFSTFCGSCCGKKKHSSGMSPIRAEQKTPRHSRVSAGEFPMGAVCPALRLLAAVRWEQAGRASRTS